MSDQQSTIEQFGTQPDVASAEVANTGAVEAPQQVPASSGTGGSAENQRRRSIPPLHFIVEIAIIVIFVTTFIVQAFRVPSESMENTLLIGDFVLADKLHFAAGDANGLQGLFPYRAIQRGDIIVFHYPVDPSQYFVKRVIGLPGDRVHLEDKTVVVNGVPLHESYVVHSMRNIAPFRDTFPLELPYSGNVDRLWRSELKHNVSHGELVVPPGKFFVMGDNRDQSLDSRFWGFVPRSYVIGRPLVIYMSLNDQTSPENGAGNGKLFNSGQTLGHFLQLARWNRVFRLVR